MGCHVSKDAERPTPKVAQVKGLAPVRSPKRSQPVHLSVGASVPTDLSAASKAIVFVFGGPGSEKGFLIEELVTRLDFAVISTEDVVLTCLPHKLANSVETTHEVQELLRTDPDLLSLEWVLDLVGARLASTAGHRFVVDIVPNLLAIQQSSSFSRDDLTEPLRSFERRHPVMFALNFAGPADLPAQKNLSDPAVDPDAKSSFQGSDEIDNNRLRRRREIYSNSAAPFVKYFGESERLVTLEVKKGSWGRSWEALRSFLASRHLLSTEERERAPQTSLLFFTEESELNGAPLDGVWRAKASELLMGVPTGGAPATLDDVMSSAKAQLKKRGPRGCVQLDVLHDPSKAAPRGRAKRRISFLETADTAPSLLGNFQRIAGGESLECVFPASLEASLAAAIAAAVFRAQESRDSSASLDKVTAEVASVSSAVLRANQVDRNGSVAFDPSFGSEATA